MGYIRKHLLPGEALVYKARIHLFIFVQPIVILLMGWWFVGMEPGIYRYLGWLLAFLGAVSLLQRVLIVAGSDYGVTDRRLIFKGGVINRRVNELVHNKIEGIFFTQPLMGRLFGYGTILVTTGGAVDSFPYVADPVDFRIAIYQAIEASRLRHLVSKTITD